jgi:hypothetical protein
VSSFRSKGSPQPPSVECLYRVTVDAAGNRISDTYQSSGHGTLPFDASANPIIPVAVRDHQHNMASFTDVATSSGYRFFVETVDTLPADRARKANMDTTRGPV